MTAEAIREITIAASPATVFAYLVESERMVQWMGTEATLQAVPGGEYRVLCAGVNPSAGRFVEVVPNERVVFTFGWDVPGHPIPAGSTTVEITLKPVGNSTLLRLVHSGLPDDAVADHLKGWDYYLNRLVRVGNGEDTGPDNPHLGNEQAESEVHA